MNASSFRMVHATDIHYSPSTKEHVDEVIKALKCDMRDQLNKDDEVLFVISGDVAQSGEAISQYDDFGGLILDMVTENNLKTCTVPGNHDVSRDFIKNNYANILGISSNNPNAQTLSNYLDGQEEFFRKSMAKYIQFESYFEGLKTCETSVFGTGHSLNHDLGIYLLNTGFSSFGGLKLGERKTDYGNLLLNLNPLKKWISETPETKRRVLSMHHPLAWFREDVRNELGRLIDLHFGLVLLGHEHEPKMSGSHGFQGHNCLTLQGGALASSEHERQFYQILDFDFHKNSIKTSIRHFSKSLVSFNPGTTITGSNCGTKTYSPVWTSRDNEIFQPAIKKYQQRIERSLNSSAHGKSNTYLDPSITSKPIQDYTDRKNAKKYTLEELGQTLGAILIHTPSQYGASILAQSLAVSLLSSGQNTLVVSANELPKHKHAVEKYVGEALEEIGTELNVPINNFVIDDYDTSKVSHSKAKTVLQETYPESRSIILNKLVKISDTQDAYESIPNENVFFLNAISKRSVRELIRKHPASSQFESNDEITENVVIEIERLNLHRNPFTVMMITDIFAKDGIYSPINRARLVKRYFEEVFNREYDSVGYTEDLDFEDNMHLLTDFTATMEDDEEFTFEKKSWDEFCLKFKEDFGGNWSSEDALQFYINKNIFKKGVERYHFSQSMWTWYFLAMKANKDSDFMSSILKEARYRAFPQVLEFASGLSRNDIDIIDVLEADLKEAISNYRTESSLGNDFNPYDGFKLSLTEESLDKFNKSLANHVISKVPDINKEDNQADEIYNFGAPFHQIVKKTIYTENLIQLFKSLETTALCIRNLDQTKLQRRLGLCRLYLEGLELFSQALFLSIPKLLSEGQAYVSGMLFILHRSSPLPYDEANEEEKRNRELSLILSMPGRISETLLESMGSARLWGDLPKPPSFDVSPFAKTLLCIGHINLRNLNWVSDVLKYINDFDSNSIFIEIIKKEIIKVVSRNSLNEVIKVELHHLLAGTMLRQKGVKNITKARCKNEWQKIRTYETTKKLTKSDKTN